MISSIAWLMETPGFRLKLIVSDGSWPEWLIASGPTSSRSVMTESSGTSCPVEERMYSMESTVGSVWYCLSSSIITW